MGLGPGVAGASRLPPVPVVVASAPALPPLTLLTGASSVLEAARGVSRASPASPVFPLSFGTVRSAGRKRAAATTDKADEQERGSDVVPSMHSPSVYDGRLFIHSCARPLPCPCAREQERERDVVPNIPPLSSLRLSPAPTPYPWEGSGHPLGGWHCALPLHLSTSPEDASPCCRQGG